jgi:peptidoglycan/xylan/chitin deacetylase (PgdA/CDA1 family)
MRSNRWQDPPDATDRQERKIRRGLKIGGVMTVAAGVVAAAFFIGGGSGGANSAAATSEGTPPSRIVPVSIPVDSSPRPAACHSGYVALTFDDGPTKLTSKLLAVLRQIGVKATFFDLGSHALEYPAQVKQESLQGWVGNHSFSHPDLVSVGEPAAFKELLGTNQVLQRITGQTPTLFRPPFAATNHQVEFDARDLGLTSVIWTTESHDYGQTSTAQIEANAEKVAPGGIILFHDGNERTIKALPVIVDNLAARGLCAGQIVSSAQPIVTSWGQTFNATVVHW